MTRGSGLVTNKPNPSAESRSAASRIGPASALIERGPRSRPNTALNGNGGHCSKASQLVSTNRPIRSGWASITSWQIPPPVSQPTNVTLDRPRAVITS